MLVRPILERLLVNQRVDRFPFSAYWLFLFLLLLSILPVLPTQQSNNRSLSPLRQGGCFVLLHSRVLNLYHAPQPWLEMKSVMRASNALE